MHNRLIGSTAIAFVAITLSAGMAQAQSSISSSGHEHETQYSIIDFLARMQASSQARSPRSSSLLFGSKISPSAVGPNLQVLGGGTAGRLTKWVGFSPTNSYIGDTTIFEDKYGKVGIGTDTPTSKLTVFGVIESTSGGFKFPDGTTQTTSAAGSLLTVIHNSTLIGAGTGGSPLGVSIPLSLTGSSSNPIISAINTATAGSGLAASGGANGIGIEATGGDGINGLAGFGMKAKGGNDNVTGAGGILGVGGNGVSQGGPGVIGVGGDSTNFGGIGVLAVGANATGQGKFSGTGIVAHAGNATNGASPGRAGLFNGHVAINGNLDVIGTVSKGGGSFKIDHPLDPENKFLFHSFVESPDMKNIYDGTVVTDENGEATVQLPDYFEALNIDFRYQLTVIGQFAQAIIANKIKDNRFSIRTSAPNVEVSWQVTGIRQDAWAKKNRIQIEVEKDHNERGHYVHPEVFNQPEDKSIEWARSPELAQRLRDMGEKAKRQ